MKHNTLTSRSTSTTGADLSHSALIAHQLLQVAAFCRVDSQDAAAPAEQVGTLLSNMAYFGFAPSLDALAQLKALSSAELAEFWRAVEPSFRVLTGDDRKMDDFVVYKNFPGEVLAMSQAQYWLNQILMYVGAPNEWFCEEPAVRASLDDRLKLKVLEAADGGSLLAVYRTLVANKARWTDAQSEYALHLVRALGVTEIDLSTFGFKENGIAVIAATLDTEGSVTIADATDVLRLAALLSGGDAGLREDFKFRSFSRSERRLMLGLLDESKNLLADMGLRPALWKQLLSKLHPGDFKFRKVIEAYHALYEGAYTTFNADVEAKLQAKDVSVLAALAARPGDFARRLHKLCTLFGMDAVSAFAPVAGKLETSQLLKLRGYLTTVNGRGYLIHPPKGNWNKAKFVPNAKAKLSDEVLTGLKSAIDTVLANRLAKALPQGVDLAEDAGNVKLQTNDQELAPYGRGTVFPIPTGMTFLRSASYWKHRSGEGSSWFDNSWNFFDEAWNTAGTCCWNATDMGGAAVFSGDPTNSKDMQGRACQMIDLNLDKLASAGVRYAVWSVLCYSNVPFSGADDVLATLQWGEHADKGKLYEPARAQMVFPLKGENKTKYIAYIDVRERKLVYMDANLAGRVDSARSNEAKLAEMMPAFVEYLRALPSVADLFQHAPKGVVPVMYSDAQRALPRGEKAYVFKPENAANSFEALQVGELL